MLTWRNAKVTQSTVQDLSVFSTIYHTIFCWCFHLSISPQISLYTFLRFSIKPFSMIVVSAVVKNLPNAMPLIDIFLTPSRAMQNKNKQSQIYGGHWHRHVSCYKSDFTAQWSEEISPASATAGNKDRKENNSRLDLTKAKWKLKQSIEVVCWRVSGRNLKGEEKNRSKV